MGCFQSQQFEPDLHKKKSFRWSSFMRGNKDFDASEIKLITGVWNVLEAQGTDMDVMFITFEKLFEQNPGLKLVFDNAGKFDDVDGFDFKADVRFRAHVREVAKGMGTIVASLDDHEALTNNLKYIRELHEKVKGVESKSFQMISPCFYHAILDTMGSSIDKETKATWWKFIVYVSDRLKPIMDRRKPSKKSEPSMSLSLTQTSASMVPPAPPPPRTNRHSTPARDKHDRQSDRNLQNLSRSPSLTAQGKKAPENSQERTNKPTTQETAAKTY